MSIFDEKVTNCFDADFDFNKDGKLDLSEQSIKYEYVRQRLEEIKKHETSEKETEDIETGNFNHYVVSLDTPPRSKTPISKKIRHFFSTWGIFLFNAVAFYFEYRNVEGGESIYRFFVCAAIFTLPIFLLMARDD